MEEIISNLGFPIASVVGLAYYFAQYVSDVNAKSNNSKSLEIDVSNLRNNENSNLFIKEREVTDFETGEAKIVENIDMKSMLHLALLEIKNLKEEVRILKNKTI